jgi:hypothetical protein
MLWRLGLRVEHRGQIRFATTLNLISPAKPGWAVILNPINRWLAKPDLDVVEGSLDSFLRRLNPLLAAPVSEPAMPRFVIPT